MDLQSTLHMLLTNVNPINVILAVLLIAQTVVSENPNIKASSLYGVIKTLLFTAIDQVKVQPAQEAAKAEEAPKA